MPPVMMSAPLAIQAPKRSDGKPDYHKIPEQNPVLTGYPLRIASTVIANVTPIKSFLYSNAGFKLLSKIPELAAYYARWDPTVTVRDEYNDLERTLVESSESKDRTFYASSDFTKLYRSKELTPTQVVTAILPLISHGGYFEKAILVMQKELILEAALASTQRWAAGKPLGPLDGVPTAVKDEIDLKGYPPRTMGIDAKFTPASTLDSEGLSTYSSWCVAKLQEAGAIVIGKTNMHPLGLDTTGFNLHFGTPPNVYSPNHYPGGSSSGSGSIVGAGIAPITVGCDGGGSIRVPASLAGCYGLKPSHGRVSIAPTIGMAPSLGVTGPLASTVEDLTIAFRVMAQPDPSDVGSREFSEPLPLLAKGIGTPSFKLGIYRDWFADCPNSILAPCDQFVSHISAAPYSFPTAPDITIPYLVEASMGHSLTILNEIYGFAVSSENTSLPVQPVNKVLFAVTTQTESLDLQNAQRMRSLLMSHMKHLFETHGSDLVILTPVMPHAAVRKTPADAIAGKSDGNTTIRSTRFLFFANLTGLPCVSFPVGYVEEEGEEKGLPVGMMAHGVWGSEEKLLKFAEIAERYLCDIVGRQRGAAWVDVLDKAKAVA